MCTVSGSESRVGVSGAACSVRPEGEVVRKGEEVPHPQSWRTGMGRASGSDDA